MDKKPFLVGDDERKSQVGLQLKSEASSVQKKKINPPVETPEFSARYCTIAHFSPLFTTNPRIAYSTQTTERLQPRSDLENDDREPWSNMHISNITLCRDETAYLKFKHGRQPNYPSRTDRPRPAHTARERGARTACASHTHTCPSNSFRRYIDTGDGSIKTVTAEVRTDYRGVRIECFMKTK